jgi:phosphoglycolate phosphatase-like HAD superfamily hydrolase
MVGDASTDITAGKNADCKTALTQSREFSSSIERPDISAENLASVAERILYLASRQSAKKV